MEEANEIVIEFKQKKKPDEIINTFYENPAKHIYYLVDQTGNCYVSKIIKLKQIPNNI